MSPRRLASIAPAIVLVLAASVIAGTVDVGATCEGTGISVTIRIWDSHLTPGPDWTSVVLYRRAMGSDGEPIALNAEAPFAWSIDDFESTNIDYVDSAIEPNRGYQYFARVRDAEGQEFVEGAGGSPARNWAGCGAFPIGRGVLDYEIYVASGSTFVRAFFDPVCDGYWSQTSFCPDLDLEEFFGEWYPYVGRTLELRGRYVYDGMPMGCAWAIDDIVPIEDCSGQVSTVSRSWGAIKQMYD
jgi:hypothetical protein